MSDITKATPVKFKSITMERTKGYFADGINYKVKILSNGKVSFSGADFGQEPQKLSWKIDSKEIDALNKVIHQYGFFSIKKVKPTYFATDLSSCTTTIVLEDETKRKTDNYHGDDCYPEKLNKLENKIDKLIGTKDYIGKGE